MILKWIFNCLANIFYFHNFSSIPFSISRCVYIFYINNNEIQIKICVDPLSNFAIDMRMMFTEQAFVFWPLFLFLHKGNNNKAAK